MSENSPKVKYLKDYKKPDYKIEAVHLDFDLDEENTQVSSTMKIKSDYDASTGEVRPLHLDGDELTLTGIAINGRPLEPEEYVVDDKGLTILNPPKEFELSIGTEIHPKANTKLEGLYVSNGMFCTQCEPEGFRRITYYPDHPDCMSVFTTTIRADKDKLPCLLSNGNMIKEEQMEDGRTAVTWYDPFPKPSYLFALVGGDLDYINDKFVTMSGREVTLGVYANKGQKDKLGYTMDSIKRSMAWDEQAFGREYDLDLFNLVAVSDFNQGAMENKGLNIFNSSYVIADAHTATDEDYAGIEGVVGHEYFHNWSGDRVTVRDWFNLSLKEGLTVYRDQEFSRDMRSRSVNRIEDVAALRAGQFAEDAGPTAHAVRPESYVEINNFYTSTIYNKGAEIVRMYEKMLGKEKFREANDLHFSRNDGKAVTIDDYAKCMEDVSGMDLTQFKRWYSQAGTPSVYAEGVYDEKTQTYTLKLRQTTKPTPGQETKLPFVIPMEMGLLDKDGNDMPLQLAGEKEPQGTSRVMIMDQDEVTLTFVNVKEKPVLSANRDFTAPINFHMDYTDAERAHLMAHDSDLFNRWDAAQQYGVQKMLEMVKDIQAGKEPKVDEGYLNALGSYLKDPSLDKAFVAKALELPSEKYIADQMDVVDVDAVAKARSMVSKAFVERFEKDLVNIYDSLNVERPFEPVAKDAGERALKNTALAYLASTEKQEYADRVMAQYESANNMTDRFAALKVAAGMEAGKPIVADFYNRFKDEELVVNKWLGVVASEGLEGAKSAVNHEAFAITNPNKVRAVMRRFSGNQKAFHAKDGSGYEFVADMVLKLDGINPLVAADVAKPLASWRRFDPERQAMMKGALEKILEKPGLSKNVYEVVSKSLGDTETKKARILENKAKLQKRAKTDAFLKREPLKVFVSGAHGKESEPVHAALLEGKKAKVVSSSANIQAARNKAQER
ncbi:MAG: aminopeptidase N [Alphaproteobacteria bacterium]|nr:aminopeptidase N [Alphaproteobacteria bacterium]